MFTLAGAIHLHNQNGKWKRMESSNLADSLLLRQKKHYRLAHIPTVLCDLFATTCYGHCDLLAATWHGHPHALPETTLNEGWFARTTNCLLPEPGGASWLLINSTRQDGVIIDDVTIEHLHTVMHNLQYVSHQVECADVFLMIRHNISLWRECGT